MKFKVKLILIIATLLMEAITCLSGYATTGMERAAKATGKMQTMEENILLRRLHKWKSPEDR